MVYFFVCDVLVFFFKQKTAYEMRISDWSSDVCSSDLTFFEGEQIKDMPGHEVMGVAARWTASTYDRFYDPAPDAINPLMHPPGSVEELRELIPVLTHADIVTRVTFGSLMALLTAADRLDAAGVGNKIGKAHV